MAVQNYKDWKDVVEHECIKLSTVKDYLNADGMERLRVFRALCESACFAPGPCEMMEMVSVEAEEFTSHHAIGPIKALERIANKEKAEAEEKRRQDLIEKKNAAGKTFRRIR